MVDFNKPVTLQLGPEPAPASVHTQGMLMDDFFKKYYGDPATIPHGHKFKPDPKGWYEHTLLVKTEDLSSKKKTRTKQRAQ
mmetsp:Transcript_66109/g.103220  ORF Transcript_66109/g.103220 Transcript_66109/m.103220 type:complete len:81 (+) Transcript_66109:57-299(+)|eukprot:CAMPEP_0169114484 /NCGR_PEP_ID=MMETSP1015-20121227/28782_1 /TAXON_ID=342587 /ORGANISM="Karlodinium micrum, Strain CCMP2283" /LENGTH=80 /DNA_ID=CAMNT_0009176769 /DNA_START=58 /DNA_END=300 /DNA_ORIENTATION=+